jgi:hypothetical protein
VRADEPRDHGANRRRELFLEVVRALDRYEAGHRHGHRSALAERVVFAVQLNGLGEARAIEGRLHVAGDRHPVLEADDRALIEPEEIACLLAEASVSQISGESVRQPEIALEQRHPHRRRQVHHDDVRLAGNQNRRDRPARTTSTPAAIRRRGSALSPCRTRSGCVRQTKTLRIQMRDFTSSPLRALRVTRARQQKRCRAVAVRNRMAGEIFPERQRGGWPRPE